MASALFIDAASIQPKALFITLPCMIKVVAICEYAILNGIIKALILNIVNNDDDDDDLDDNILYFLFLFPR